MATLIVLCFYQCRGLSEYFGAGVLHVFYRLCCACVRAAMPGWVKSRVAEAADTQDRYLSGIRPVRFMAICSSIGYYGMIRGEGEAPSPAKINTAVQNDSAFPTPKSISTKPLSPHTSSFISK